VLSKKESINSHAERVSCLAVGPKSSLFIHEVESIEGTKDVLHMDQV